MMTLADSDRFERLAEEFYEATGILAPGKDAPVAMGGGASYDERVTAWLKWNGERYDAMERDAERWHAVRPEVERLRDFCVRVYDTLGLSHDCKPEYALSEIEALQDAARGVTKVRP